LQSCRAVKDSNHELLWPSAPVERLDAHLRRHRGQCRAGANRSNRRQQHAWLVRQQPRSLSRTVGGPADRLVLEAVQSDATHSRRASPSRQAWSVNSAPPKRKTPPGKAGFPAKDSFGDRGDLGSRPSSFSRTSFWRGSIGFGLWPSGHGPVQVQRPRSKVFASFD